jgi:hypothetical protein
MSEYLISQEQLERIKHFQRMFELNARIIQDLCSSEKDDVVYGFKLGEVHSHLRQCFLDMAALEGEIRTQDFKPKKK